MYWDIDLTSEDEDEMINKIAEKIHESGMDVAAVLMMGSFKPLTYVGSQMGRFFISPFLPALGPNYGKGGEKFFQLIEKRENLDKIITAVEELAQQEEERKKIEKAKKPEKSPKKGWRRFLPF